MKSTRSKVYAPVQHLELALKTSNSSFKEFRLLMLKVSIHSGGVSFASIILVITSTETSTAQVGRDRNANTAIMPLKNLTWCAANIGDLSALHETYTSHLPQDNSERYYRRQWVVCKSRCILVFSVAPDHDGCSVRWRGQGDCLTGAWSSVCQRTTRRNGSLRTVVECPVSAIRVDSIRRIAAPLSGR